MAGDETYGRKYVSCVRLLRPTLTDLFEQHRHRHALYGLAGEHLKKPQPNACSLGMPLKARLNNSGSNPLLGNYHLAMVVLWYRMCSMSMIWSGS